MGALLGELLGHEPLLKAYLSYAPRTCGSPGCHCRRGELHPAWIVRLPQGRNRSVSAPVYERLRPPAAAYQRFRAAARRWRRLAREAEQLLRELEALRRVDAQGALEEKHTDG
jgi:hypothetical protein